MPIQTCPQIFLENHLDIAEALAHELARNQYVERFRAISMSELRAMLDRLLDHYANWCEGDEQEAVRCLDFLENTCFYHSIPLVEAAYALYVIRDGMMAAISRGQEAGKSESIQQVARFFELLVRDLLRRY